MDANIWNLEKYKVEGKNKYSDMVDKAVLFDFWNREVAIRDLFESTTDQDVKQVLRYAMELNNHYRKQAMDLFHKLDAINDSLDGIRKLAGDAILDSYL